jgi:type IV secretory pathway TrbF-like protein
MTTPLPPVNQATHRFLDKQDALLSVTNTLKGLLAVALLVIAFQAWNSSRLAKLLGSREPLVVRQDAVGFAEAVTVNNTHSKIDEASAKYFLMHWVQNNLERRHATVVEQYSTSLHFFTRDLFDKVSAEDSRSKWLAAFLDSQGEEIHIQVTNVVPQIDSQPYSARVDFIKKYVQPGAEDNPLNRTERWTANIQFTQLDKVPNDMVPYNPLGFVMSTLPRFNQEFTTDDHK